MKHIPRLYIPYPSFKTHGCIPVSTEHLHHLQRVLALQEESEVLVFNGIDGEWRGRVYMPIRGKKTTRQESKAYIRLESPSRTQPQTPSFFVYLVASILKRDALGCLMDYAVQAGVHGIVLLLAENRATSCVPHSYLEKRVIQSCEQTGRLTVPWIQGPFPPAHVQHKLWEGAHHLYLDGDAPIGLDMAIKHSLTAEQLRPEALSVFVWIGPEGGWSRKEKEDFARNGTQASLGTGILRAPLAAFAAVHRTFHYIATSILS